MNRELYGPRWWKHGKSVRWVRALEVQRRGVIHYHALLGGAGVDELRRLSWMDEWDQLAGYARIEQPANGEAVRAYCAKYVAKGGELDLWAQAPRRPRRQLGAVPGRWLRAPRALDGAEDVGRGPSAAERVNLGSAITDSADGRARLPAGNLGAVGSPLAQPGIASEASET
jgi:hypothetical protein